jgi:hypothetical protein
VSTRFLAIPASLRTSIEDLSLGWRYCHQKLPQAIGTIKLPDAIGINKLPERQINGASYTLLLYAFAVCVAWALTGHLRLFPLMPIK